MDRGYGVRLSTGLAAAALLLTGCAVPSGAADDERASPGHRSGHGTPYWVNPEGPAARHADRLRAPPRRPGRWR
ncbi:hypothetical protein [Streptomyces sp. NPDC048845]|uniref:hypothetical protein n=1 Tax=Streptomyces sp. NPDC048845 TaxID=3155390 RepID=UPI003423A6D3